MLIKCIFSPIHPRHTTLNPIGYNITLMAETKEHLALFLLLSYILFGIRAVSSVPINLYGLFIRSIKHITTATVSMFR